KYDFIPKTTLRKIEKSKSVSWVVARSHAVSGAARPARGLADGETGVRPSAKLQMPQIYFFLKMPMNQWILVMTILMMMSQSMIKNFLLILYLLKKIKLQQLLQKKKEELKTHLKGECVEEVTHILGIKTEPDMEEYMEEDSPTKKKQYTCLTCNVTFPNMSILYQHKQRMHKVPEKEQVIGGITETFCTRISTEIIYILCANVISFEFTRRFKCMYKDLNVSMNNPSFEGYATGETPCVRYSVQ
ncbi:unnamed protein product, partial [Trichogramma brassicae]